MVSLFGAYMRHSVEILDWFFSDYETQCRLYAAGRLQVLTNFCQVGTVPRTLEAGEYRSLSLVEGS